jgi:IclR family transcriptional regulator, acetate operon repressor
VRSGSQSVERALAVLDCLTRSRTDLGVSDVAARTGLTVSTTHRLIRALVDAGLLGQDERSARYHLGPTLIAMGRRAESSLGFDRLEPALRALSARAGEAVNLGTMVGDEILVTLHVPSPQLLRFGQPAGTRLSLEASAMGRAMLAFGAGPSSPTLLEDLAEARRSGWTTCDADGDGVRTIGVPLLRADGVAFAAIAIEGPLTRIPDERVAELAGDLMKTAADLSIASY